MTFVNFKGFLPPYPRCNIKVSFQNNISFSSLTAASFLLLGATELSYSGIWPHWTPSCQVILHNILKENYRLKVVRLQASPASLFFFFFNPSLSRLCENLIKDDKFRSWWNGSYCHFIDIWRFQWIISVWINIETRGAEEHRGLTTITSIYLGDYHYHYSITKEILLAFSALNIAVVWRSIHPARSHD